MKSPARHLEALDYIRGIAILAVLLFHTLGPVYGYDELPWKGWFRDFSGPGSFFYFLPISAGLMGVPVFFVVSGFCIHLSFQQQGQRWGDFFIRRIFRIYPAYLAALLFFALLYLQHFRLDWTSGQLWNQLLAHVFLVHNYQNATIGSINGSFWSMAVEAQLYLLYPVLIFLVASVGWRRTLIILALIEIAIRGTEGVLQTLGATETIAGRFFWTLTISPLGYWFSWSMGAAIAGAHLQNKPLPFLRSPFWLWPTLAVGAYFIRPLDNFRFLLFAVMTAVAISKLLARPDQSQTKIPPSWLSALKMTGLWSYSLYLLHQPLLVVYFSVINWIAPDALRPAPMIFALMAATWLVIIPFSILWYHVFEIPGIALGKKIIQWRGRRREAGFNLINAGEIYQAPRQRRAFLLMTCGTVLLAAGSVLAGFKLMPPDAAASNNLAWTLATNPDPGMRNGARAVELAEAACQQTKYQETILVGTLAAAYAEAGRFDEAVLTAQHACDLAAEKGETSSLARNRELLQLYENHLAYHETGK